MRAISGYSLVLFIARRQRKANSSVRHESQLYVKAPLHSRETCEDLHPFIIKYATGVRIGDKIIHMPESVLTKSLVEDHVQLDHSQNAKDATEQEKNMGLSQAIQLYPKAVAWAVFISAAIIMKGYDIVLLSSFYALPQFSDKFGVNSMASS